MPLDTFFNLNKDKQNQIIEAAINEFTNNTYKEVKISNIVRSAKIPRGSFYQYFSDKKDLYKYLINGIMAQRKLEFLSPKLSNPSDLSFLDLFRELYKSGLDFAIAYPKMILITRNLLLDRSMFDELLKDSLQIARTYYRSYIKRDKEKGIIDDTIDTETLIDIVIQNTTTIAFDELVAKKDIDKEIMLEKLEKIIHILKKGIER